MPDLTKPFGGIQISDGDAAATEWLAEAKRRYATDAEFHYRVESVNQAMRAAYVNFTGVGHLAVALLLDEKVRKANGLH